MPRPRVVVVGGGFAAIRAAKRLDGLARTTVVAPDDRFVYLPLVHELISEESRPRSIVKPLSEIVEGKLVLGTAQEIRGNELITDSGRVPFDQLIVAIGAVTRWFGVPGAREAALPLWSLEDGLRINARLKELLLAGRRDGRYRVVVVGAGPTGLEVAGEAAAFFERYEAPYEIDVLEMRDQLLPTFTPEFRSGVRAGLGRYRIKVRLGTKVHRVGPDHVRVEDKEGVHDLPSDVTVWCAGIEGRVLPPLSMKVDGHLRSAEREDVWIAGDCARYPPDLKVPLLAQTAEQAAEVAAYNALHPERPRRFEPRLAGTLISTGPGFGVAEFAGGAVLKGNVPWHIKKRYYKWRLAAA